MRHRLLPPKSVLEMISQVHIAQKAIMDKYVSIGDNDDYELKGRSLSELQDNFFLYKKGNYNHKDAEGEVFTKREYVFLCEFAQIYHQNCLPPDNRVPSGTNYMKEMRSLEEKGIIRILGSHAPNPGELPRDPSMGWGITVNVVSLVDIILTEYGFEFMGDTLKKDTKMLPATPKLKIEDKTEMKDLKRKKDKLTGVVTTSSQNKAPNQWSIEEIYHDENADPVHTTIRLGKKIDDVWDNEPHIEAVHVVPTGPVITHVVMAEHGYTGLEVYLLLSKSYTQHKTKFPVIKWYFDNDDPMVFREDKYDQTGNRYVFHQPESERILRRLLTAKSVRVTKEFKTVSKDKVVFKDITGQDNVRRIMDLARVK